MSLNVRDLRVRDIGRTVVARQRFIFLTIGTLTLIAGLVLPNIVMCTCGMLLVGSFAWDAVPGSPESARVRMWQWLHKSAAHHR